MKLLVTGAFKTDASFCSLLQSLGFEITFWADEKAKVTDPSIYDGAICNGLFLYNDIKEFAALKFIQLTSAGLDRVPLNYIRAHDIHIYNARGVYSIPMAEYAIGGVLQLYGKAKAFYKSQEEHKWEKRRDIYELYNKKVCIFGCGSVGGECAKRFRAMGCYVAGVDIKPYSNVDFNVMYSMEDSDDALRDNDIIILTLPLTKGTLGLFDKDKLSKMKQGSILVNISRGKIVRQDDLVIALKSHLGGAVLDVFEEEPLDAVSPLWGMDNVIITPHVSFIGDGNQKRLEELIITNLKKEAQL